MADFHQGGLVNTFHRLKHPNLKNLEANLKEFKKRRPIALVLPTLYSELERPALKNIIKTLKKVPYLNEVIITMNRANKTQFNKARKFFDGLPQDHIIIWNDGPNVKKLYKILHKNEFYVGLVGKGQQAWMAYGFILANNKSRVITLHDCDVITYDREFLARLCYPVGNASLGIEFAKGYYSRATGRLYGRVTRLFFSPLIRSLIKILGHLPYLEYLNDFRYPLAGEFSMTVDLARGIRIPGDWGLEIGVLGEIFRNTSIYNICQVEICENYEHKHQPLSASDPKRGLTKMSVDITKSLFRTLASEGVVLSKAFFLSLVTTYLRTAQDTIKRYHGDAAINSLIFDRHQEAVAVEAFIKAIQIASDRYLDDPLGHPLIPSWNRVTSAIPDFLDILIESVKKDNR
jgi:glucosyl-3-phosphoglycerate synthase